MLFRQIDTELHGLAKNKMMVEHLSKEEWLSENNLNLAWDNKDAKLTPQLLVPGNGLYFIFSSDRETRSRLTNIDVGFVKRYLRIRDVLGNPIRKEGSNFIIPAGENCYRLYLSDKLICIGILVSLFTIALLVLTREKLAIFLKPKERSIL